MLFQNKHPEKIVREGTRMLKQEGKMLVIDWKEGRFPFGPKADVKIKHDEVDNLALTAGLKKIKDIEVGKFHYGILFEKI